MTHSMDPRRVVRCQFSPHRADGTRRLSKSHVFLYLLLPLGIGWATGTKLPTIDRDFIALVIATYSILAAVLVGLLPVVYSIVGQTDRLRKYSAGERPLAQQELNRLEALQDLYATISYSTFLLVLALFCAVGLVFTLPQETQNSPVIETAMRTSRYLSMVIYFVGASTILSILNVGNGIFDAMEDQVRVTKNTIRASISQEDPAKTVEH